MPKSNATRTDSDGFPVADGVAKHADHDEIPIDEVDRIERDEEGIEEREVVDDGFEEDDFYSDDDGPGSSRRKARKRRTCRLLCFHCNRQEVHYNAYRGLWFYSFILGLTFGLASFVGPFKCQCCGHKRLMCWDFLNPRVWLRRKGKYSKR